MTPLMMAYALPFVRLKNKAGHSHEHAQNRDAHGDVRIVEHCTDRWGAKSNAEIGHLTSYHHMVDARIQHPAPATLPAVTALAWPV